MNLVRAIRFASVMVAAISSVHAHAQAKSGDDYPQQPVRLIVGYAAGGANDVVARIVGQKLSERLGQPVIVENKTGAGGMIGAEYVSKAKPDGHTLLFAASSMFTTNPVMYKKVPYAASNFAPISMVVNFPFFVLVGAQHPVTTVQELREYWKAKPEIANCSGAAGVHQLGFALFKSKTGNTGELISYRGTNEAISAVIAGTVLMTIADGAPVASAISGGRVRALAVTATKRLAAYPNIPTIAEAGLPDMEMQSWFGLLAPAGTPAAVVKRLQQEVHQLVNTKEFEQQVSTLNVIPQDNTPDQFASMIASDLARWRAVAKAGGIEPGN